MKVAREVLRRYPALRQTWPVREARAWREQRERRLHPRRMASWYRDMPDMHTRIFVSNLEMPEAPHICQPTSVNIALLDPDGASITSRRFKLARNASLVIEVSDLLPVERRGHLPTGQVLIDFEGGVLGSSRSYLHWYNDRSLTSSHEKFGLSIPAVAGYWTVPNVQHDPSYRTHLAVANLDDKPYTSTVTLKDASGTPRETSLVVPPGGSRFAALDELFEDPGAFLAGGSGVLFFGNNSQPAMYYYFVRNDTLGTWRAQHL